MIVNSDEAPSHFLTYRISSAFQKWTELKHLLTDRRIVMSSRIKILEACVRSRLLYGCSIVGTFCIRNKQNRINLARIFYENGNQWL